jgi:uncharacterized membrane protein
MRLSGENPSLRPRAWILAALALSASLNFLFLDRKSFWVDEIYSYTFATAPLDEFWQIVSGFEANMALYYGVLRVWVLAGESAFWIRSLSAVLALGAVVGVYVLATRLAGRRAGLIAAVLLAINPLVITYAQEARGYALFLFLVVGSNILFVRALERPHALAWVAYAVVTSLAVYSHFFAALTVVYHGIAILLLPRAARPPARLLVLAACVIAIVVAPLAVFVVARDVGQLKWVRVPDLRKLAGVFAAMSGNKWLLVPYGALSLVAVLAALRERRSADGWRRLWSCGLLLAWLVVPVTVAFAVSQVKPAFVARFFIAGVPALVMLGAWGLDRLPGNVARAAALLAIAGLTVPSLVSYYRADKAGWKEATSIVLSQADERDAVVVFVPAGRDAFEYYARQQRGPSTAPRLVTLPETGQTAFLQGLARDHPRVWLVLGHIRRSNVDAAESFEEALAQSYPAVSEWELRDVRVLLYHRDAAPETSRR